MKSNPKTDLNQQLHEACKKGELEVVKRLIDEGADVNAKDLGWTPLHEVAAFSGNIAIARLLIEKGADVNAKDWKGMTPAASAWVTSRSELLELFKQHGGKRFAIKITAFELLVLLGALGFLLFFVMNNLR